MHETLELIMPENLRIALEQGQDFSIELKGEIPQGTRVLFCNAREFKAKHENLYSGFLDVFQNEDEEQPINSRGEEVLERALKQKGETANPYVALLVDGDEQNPNVISAVVFTRDSQHKDNNGKLAYEFLDLASPHDGDGDFEADRNLRILSDTVLSVINIDTQNDHDREATILSTLPFCGFNDFRRNRLIQQLLFSIADNWSLRLREDIPYMREMHTFDVDPNLFTVAFTVHQKLRNLFGDFFRTNSFVLMKEEVCYTNESHVDYFKRQAEPNKPIKIGDTLRYTFPGLTSSSIRTFRGLFAEKQTKRAYIRFAAGRISYV